MSKDTEIGRHPLAAVRFCVRLRRPCSSAHPCRLHRRRLQRAISTAVLVAMTQSDKNQPNVVAFRPPHLATKKPAGLTSGHTIDIHTKIGAIIASTSSIYRIICSYYSTRFRRAIDGRKAWTTVEASRDVRS